MRPVTPPRGREHHQRIERRLAAREGIDDPAAGEAQPLDAATEIDSALDDRA
jgi:hypothetical protein